QAEESRQRENQAATRIQSWFRACKVRAYLSAVIDYEIQRRAFGRHTSPLAHCSTTIDFLVPCLRWCIKRAAYFIMKMNFYEEMAVRIQRRWRGFFVRKYVHNFYARKSYLEGLCRKNEIVRRELDELEELQRRERNCLEMVKEQTAKVYQAHRLHHLLSTKQCPGVFNSPFRPAPHEMEQLLRQVKYQAPTRLAPRGRACLLGLPGPTASSFSGTLGSPWTKTARTCCSSRPVLPPIASKNQQGLSREPGEVWEQRMNCPDLTLRLQSSYTHLEEAQNQLRQHESIKLLSGTV
ncbi:hypothetical protein L3Q82_008920, partial [Scortum barcoo]